MKRFLMVMVAMLALVSFAGKPAATTAILYVDPNDGTYKFVTGWLNWVVTTTPDTFIAPKQGSFAMVINRDVLGDTVLISLSQSGQADAFSAALVGGNDSRTFDFKGRYVKQIVIKAKSGTAKIEVQIMN